MKPLQRFAQSSSENGSRDGFSRPRTQEMKYIPFICRVNQLKAF